MLLLTCAAKFSRLPSVYRAAIRSTPNSKGPTPATTRSQALSHQVGVSRGIRTVCLEWCVSKVTFDALTYRSMQHLETGKLRKECLRICGGSIKPRPKLPYIQLKFGEFLYRTQYDIDLSEGKTVRTSAFQQPNCKLQRLLPTAPAFQSNIEEDFDRLSSRSPPGQT